MHQSRPVTGPGADPPGYRLVPSTRADHQVGPGRGQRRGFRLIDTGQGHAQRQMGQQLPEAGLDPFFLEWKPNRPGEGQHLIVVSGFTAQKDPDSLIRQPVYLVYANEAVV
jgi:hypothetical protein